MYILQPDNTHFDLNLLPDEVDDLHYCVLDYRTPKIEDSIDFFFHSLYFVDRYPCPAADLRIGPYRVQLPLDWSIIIADKDFGYMEVLELRKINDRPFSAFILNPISGYMPGFEEITIENVFPDVLWNVPKLTIGHILAVPLTNDPKPPCIFCVKEITRLPEVLDLTKVFS